MLSGEAGIGKSRLTAALLEGIAPEPHTRLRNFCSPQHIDSALYPTIGQIGRAAGFTRNDTVQAKLDKLDALLAQSSASADDTALFAEMLSLRNSMTDEEELPAQMDAGRGRMDITLSPPANGPRGPRQGPLRHVAISQSRRHPKRHGQTVLVQR